MFLDNLFQLLEQFFIARLYLDVLLAQLVFALVFLANGAAQLDEFAHPGLQMIHVEGLGYVGVGPYLDTLDALLDGGLGREHNDRNLTGLLVGLYLFAQLDTVHLGHHHIGNHTVGHLADNQLQPLQPVLGLDNAIVMTKNLFEVFAYVLVVLNHQQLVAEGCGRALRLLLGSVVDKVLQGRLHQGCQTEFAPIGQHLLFLQIAVVDGQGDDKGGSALGRILDIDATVVYLHEAAREVQPDAGTHLVEISLRGDLIETVEYQFALFGRDSLARVGDAYLQLVAVAPYLNIDMTSLGGVFESVGKNVEDDLVQLLLVDPHLGQTRLDLHGKTNFLLLGNVVERRSNLAEEMFHIGGYGQEPHLPPVELAHLHHLVNQAQDALPVLVNQFVDIVQGTLGGLLHELFDGRQNQGERGSDLVRYVGEEL